MPTSSGQKCRTYDGKEYDMGPGGISAAQCRELQGTVVDGGSKERISTQLFKERLSGSIWGNSIDGTQLTQADYGSVLLSFPTCEVYRRFGRSPLLRSLDSLDTGFHSDLRFILKDTELRARTFQLVLEIASLAATAIMREGDPNYNVPVSAELLERGRALGKEIQSRTANQELISTVRETISLSEPLRQVAVSDLAAYLGGSKKSPGNGQDSASRESHIAEARVATFSVDRSAIANYLIPLGSGIEFKPIFDPNLGVKDRDPMVVTQPHPGIKVMLEIFAAERAIDAKAAQLGSTFTGSPAGDIDPVPGGYVRRYAACDIYYSDATGAHEIHGDIRAKYNARSAIHWIGLPTTDETGTPDGIGRFNHFQTGSIYWTPRTGPMIVTGAIRGFWASQGWETGPLGYPVADEFRLSGLYPTDKPNVGWSLFENGAIVSTKDGVARALAATLTPQQLRAVIRARFDEEVHKSPENIGLHPPVETLAVSTWSYGFWAASQRMITFRLHGFRDNGLLPDTDFELDVRLRFSATWPMSLFGAPTHKTLIAALDWIKVTAHGIASGTIANGIKDGVIKGFFRGGPDPNHPEVPDGAIFLTTFPTGISQTGTGNVDVVDVLTTSQGGLEVLVNPLPSSPINVGQLRRIMAQNAIDAFVTG